MIENPIFDTFKDLYKCHTNLADYSGVFIKDGIINIESFKNSRERTLFIAKEHNLHKKYDPNNYAADYRIWWAEHVHLAFSVRISEWAFGIESRFSVPLDAINNFQRKKALQSIAFLNVKKTAGRATANSKTISGYIDVSQKLLQRQIMEIDPTLIVCCFRYDNYPNKLFDIKMIASDNGSFSHGKWNSIDVINFFHPSSRKNKTWLYKQLSLAYNHIRE